MLINVNCDDKRMSIQFPTKKKEKEKVVTRIMKKKTPSYKVLPNGMN